MCRTPDEVDDEREEGDFYCPYGKVLGQADLLFFYRVVDVGGSDQPEFVVHPVELFGADVGEDLSNYVDVPFVLPYNAVNVCEARGDCDGLNTFAEVPFVSPVLSPPYTVGDLLTLEVYEGLTWDFDAADVTTMRFNGGEGLVVRGGLIADGLTFTAVPYCPVCSGGGWDGIAFTAGASGTLTGVTVEEFGSSGGGGGGGAVAPIPIGVSVYDADVTLAGSFVQNGTNAYGVTVQGTNGVLTVVNDGATRSEISNNTAGGALASYGGRLLLYDSDVVNNPGFGVAAYLSGSRAYLFRATVADNDGVGVRATDGAAIYFDKPTGGDPDETSFIQNNEGGGLDADGGGALWAGKYKDFPGVCYQLWNNEITGHQYGGTAPFDARSKDGSTLYAECDYWGPVSGPTDTSNLDSTTTRAASST